MLSNLFENDMNLFLLNILLVIFFCEYCWSIFGVAIRFLGFEMESLLFLGKVFLLTPPASSPPPVLI